MICSRKPKLALPNGYVRLIKFGADTPLKLKYTEAEVKAAISKLDSLWVVLEGPGECGLSIDLDRVAGEISDLTIRQGWLIGHLKILKTPCGLITQELIDANIKVKLTTVGHGTVDGNMFVAGYKLFYILLNSSVGYEI